jgi:hypothetical protein
MHACIVHKTGGIMKTTYVGLRREGNLHVYVARGKRLDPLPPRLDIRNHSPTGYECSYGGSGPAQLALAILAHATQDDDVARAHYQHFKWAVIAKLGRENWRMPQEDVMRFLASIDKADADTGDFLNHIEAVSGVYDPTDGSSLDFGRGDDGNP